MRRNHCWAHHSLCHVNIKNTSGGESSHNEVKTNSLSVLLGTVEVKRSQGMCCQWENFAQ
jgi:hypothetical protein